MPIGDSTLNLMKFYVVVRLPKPGEEIPRDLPVRFPDRPSAEEMCNHLNETKDEDQVGYVVQERPGRW
jgi:hypothetical protein